MLKSMIKKTNILESNLFTTRVLLYNQSIIPSTDVIQLTLTVKMTTAQVVETTTVLIRTHLLGTMKLNLLLK